MRVLLVLAISLAGCGFGDNGAAFGPNPPDGGGDPAIDAADPPDDGSVTPPDGSSGTCSVVPQDGCAAGDACDFNLDDGEHFCRDVVTAGTADSRCQSDTACAAGFSCLGEGNTFWCHKYCTTDNQCGAGGRCLLELEDANGDPHPESACTNACDPLAQTGCPTGTACHVFEDGPNDFTDCSLAGNLADGETCTSTNQCRPGSLCVNGSTDRCASMCDLDLDVGCLVGEICNSFAVIVRIDGTSIGFCE